MNLAELTRLENESIRVFVQKAADDGYLSGRVLDYGCGKSPYRDIVEKADTEYVGYDRADLPANMSGHDLGPERAHLEDWDAILCTQVIQYVKVDPVVWLMDLRVGLDAQEGHLVITGPTNWPEVDEGDRQRYTLKGIVRSLRDAGFVEIVCAESRWSIPFDGWEMRMGWGVVARA